MVRLLLDAGADVEAGYYNSALQIASARGNQAVVRLLPDMGADVDNELASDEDEAALSSSSTASIDLGIRSAASGRLSPASPTTPLKNQPPKEFFNLLISEVFLEPDMKDLCKRILEFKGESFFIRLFKHEIRTFCSALYTKNLTEVQKGSIRIIRRYRAYFAFCLCQLLKPSPNWQLEDLMSHTVEDVMEWYLQGPSQVNQLPQDVAAAESTSGASAVETISQDSISAKNYVGVGNYGIVSAGSWQEDNVADDASNVSFDDEIDSIPQSLTRDTISWLIKGVSYRNFKHSMTKQICSPLQYIHQVLQPRLSASELCQVTFHVEWQLIQYLNSELEEGDRLVHALTVSGDIRDAEASPCLDYCRRLWPMTGELVLDSLERAIENGRHGKYDVIC